MSKPILSKVVDVGVKLWKKHGNEVMDGMGKMLDSVQKGSKKEVLDSSSVSELAAEKGGDVHIETKGGKIIVVDVVDQDDTYFEDMLAKLQETSEKGVKSPEAATEALKVLAQCSVETIKYCAEQETKRVEILARRDAAITQINAIASLMREYLDKTFDERSKIFSKQFEILDQSLKSGDSELLSVTVNGINALAAENPFKSLQDVNQVQKQLGEGTEWDI